MAGTAAGIVSTSVEALLAPPPPNGNIFDRLDAHGISWRNYYTDLPGVAVLLDYASRTTEQARRRSTQFFTDAAAGTLPGGLVRRPATSSAASRRRTRDDIRVGEAFAAQRHQRGDGRARAGRRRCSSGCYDEHGGYYDHVPPPRAIAPDDIPPDIDVPPDLPGGYDRYGFRVPGGRSCRRTRGRTTCRTRCTTTRRSSSSSRRSGTSAR